MSCIWWLELSEHLNRVFMPLLLPYWAKGWKQREVSRDVNRLSASDEALKCVLVAGVFLPWWGHCGEAGAVGEACITASRGCSPVLTLSLVPGDCGGGHDHNCLFGPFSAEHLRASTTWDLPPFHPVAPARECPHPRHSHESNQHPISGKISGEFVLE